MNLKIINIHIVIPVCILPDCLVEKRRDWVNRDRADSFSVNWQACIRHNVTSHRDVLKEERGKDVDNDWKVWQMAEVIWDHKEDHGRLKVIQLAVGRFAKNVK